MHAESPRNHRTPWINRMKAESASHGSSSHEAASIFKNPFDVEKDQLIRQLFELPARMADLVQSRRNVLANSNADTIVSPFSVFAAKSAAQEDMGARLSVCPKTGDFPETNLKEQTSRDPVIDDMDWSSLNLMCQNKIDSAVENGFEEPATYVIKESATYGSNKRKRIELSQAALSGLENTSKSSSNNDFCISQNIFGEADAGFQKPFTPLPMSASDELSSSQQHEKLAEKCMHTTQKQAATHGSSQAGQAVSQDEAVLDLTVSAIKMKPHDVAEFIITIIRTLRHTRDNDMQKLFEMLSAPDFPVDKCSFLEDLIQQAQNYNKKVVAKELGKYRSQIILTRMNDSQRKGNP